MYKQDLYYIVEDHIKPNVLSRMNRLKKWEYGYNKEHDIVVISKTGQIGEIYNIGCDENMEYSVMEVAKMLIEMIKGTKDYDKWIEYIEDRPFNDQRYYISNQKVTDTGFKYQFSTLKEALEDLL